jgi:hypothetical protein
MKVNHGTDHARIGRALVTLCRQVDDAGWLDGAATRLVHDDGTVEHFGSVVVHRPGSPRGVAFGWLNARPPSPQRWRPRSVYGRIRWILAGRPDMGGRYRWSARLHVDGERRSTRGEDREAWRSRRVEAVKSGRAS